ncbi:elongation of very long chain fatty acids protein 7-like [Adelges cooleyi]|uniref:elongation of very long chain fatty acids protein 7-like n=1 Tax=Adelges cooleyi TaxID=133065 RepID=UPI00218028EC|nr:elongation of very long chain fatty acids protein 7-like [Adelges cooleyi]XP_050440798.1 elongation of very long chain fatty acids protein 7-like [Adelges cooleyi]
MANTSVTSGNFLVNAKDQLYDIFDKEIVRDEIVDNWWLMGSPYPVLTTVGFYLIFVLKLGPYVMKDRQPYKLKGLMLIYNIVQVIYNAFLLYWFFFTPDGVSYMWNHSCHPPKKETVSFLMFELYKGSWFYFLSKIIDLLDTVFFVLRKKQSHISLLHVYHHANMVITCWVQLRFYKNQDGILPGLINAFIHTIMYSYYFLAALGPHMQKYLWWKKYLTLMQITQFVIILTWYTGLFSFQCDFPKTYMAYMFCNICLFLYLFTMFYKKTYEQNQKTKTG